ncbi:MAG: ZPR1 zinc finger domain-containing protein [Methanomicrobiales archaeon]|nr:ZPR1 zinc finger domain-containing protein [Methanomicrobiales archaeon]
MHRVIPGPCPRCKEEIQFIYQTEEIPYFSDILLISAACDCGYRFVETMILGEGDPAMWTLHVTAPGDMEARVVRSTTGSLEIPEFGITIDPGPACDAFITNVEGVLARIEDVLDKVLTWAEGEERGRACALKDEVARAREGDVPFTLIVRDPTGNSAIISRKAEKQLLPPDAGTCPDDQQRQD